MRGHLEAIRERGEEALAGLWASEAGIYGRYGYGVATRAPTSRSARRRRGLPAAVPDARPRDGRAGRPARRPARRPRRGGRPTRPGMIARDEHELAQVLDRRLRGGPRRRRAAARARPGRGGRARGLRAVRGPQAADARGRAPTTSSSCASSWPLTTGRRGESVGAPAAGSSLSRTRALAKRAPRTRRCRTCSPTPRAVTMRLDDGLYLRAGRPAARARGARLRRARSTSCSRSPTPPARGTRAAGGWPATRRARRASRAGDARRTSRSAPASSAPPTSAARRSRRWPRPAGSRSGPRGALRAAGLAFRRRARAVVLRGLLEPGRPMRRSKPAGAWMLSIRTGIAPSLRNPCGSPGGTSTNAPGVEGHFPQRQRPGTGRGLSLCQSRKHAARRDVLQRSLEHLRDPRGAGREHCCSENRGVLGISPVV